MKKRKAAAAKPAKPAKKAKKAAKEHFDDDNAEEDEEEAGRGGALPHRPRARRMFGCSPRFLCASLWPTLLVHFPTWGRVPRRDDDGG